MEKGKFDSAHSYSMEFEIAMRILFGDKAYQLASLGSSERVVKKWLRKAIRKMVRDVSMLDSTLRHKNMLIMELKGVDDLLKSKGNLWEIIFTLFKIASRFLGYDYVKGDKLITPAYFQTPHQNSWSQLYEGREWEEILKKRESLIGMRASIVQELKTEGYSDFDVSVILGTSEYQVKKIIRECKIGRSRA